MAMLLLLMVLMWISQGQGRGAEGEAGAETAKFSHERQSSKNTLRGAAVLAAVAALSFCCIQQFRSTCTKRQASNSSQINRSKSRPMQQPMQQQEQKNMEQQEQQQQRKR